MQCWEKCIHVAKVLNEVCLCYQITFAFKNIMPNYFLKNSKCLILPQISFCNLCNGDLACVQFSHSYYIIHSLLYYSSLNIDVHCKIKSGLSEHYSCFSSHTSFFTSVLFKESAEMIHCGSY